ncbi:transposase [Streptomyces griseus]|uniref:Transposase n=1 Tax=Streptomyces griseus TaxID=1911 RepID=A0A380P966_STRGR|nr:transposase [Streptomyces griseus]
MSGKRGATRLGFAVLLKFYTQFGRFPRNRTELPGEAVEFVARQVQVPALELESYDWTGRTVEYHRAQIREHLGFRECSVADAEKLTAYLAEHVAHKERRPEQDRVELLARCRTESIEPPTSGRCDRIVGAALRKAEETLTALISSRLTLESVERIVALVAGADKDDPDVMT